MNALYKLFNTLALTAIAVVASAQTLSVAPVEATAGGQKTLTVSLSDAASATAMQFNLSLPANVTINESECALGRAASNHTLSVNKMDNGDYLFVLYSMAFTALTDGTLLTIPVTIGKDAKTGKGTLYTIRSSASDAVSQLHQNATFAVNVTTAKVKLSKTKAVIEKGKTLTLKAKVYPTTEDQTVTWKSSDKKVATVTSAGKVKGVGAGTATITCTSKATGAKATCKVTVGYVKLSKTEVTIEKGKTLTLKSKVYPSTVKDQSVTWESSDPTIVKVASSGKIKGMKAGKATITCTSNATGLKATCEVTVGYVKLNYTALTVEKGKVVALKSKVYPTTEDQSVTWESSDPTIVKVASTGKIKGLKTGTAIITCTSNATGLSATCKVTVVKAAAAPSLNGSDDEVTGIEEKATLAEEFDVYDLNGRKVLNKVTSLEGLSDGVYIVNGKKIVVKK